MRIFDRGVLKTFSPEAIGAAAQVGRVVQFENIRLAELNAKIGTFVPNRPALFDIDASVTHTLASDDAELLVHAAFDIAVRDAALEDAVFVTVKVVFEMAYRMVVPPPPKEVQDKFLGGFAQINGVFNAWPYAREIVQNTTSRMNIPPVLLPIFRIIAHPTPQQQVQPQLQQPPPRQIPERRERPTVKR